MYSCLGHKTVSVRQPKLILMADDRAVDQNSEGSADPFAGATLEASDDDSEASDDDSDDPFQGATLGGLVSDED
jgi:hypothetical protein